MNKIKEDREVPVINRTKEYTIFKKIIGNREIRRETLVDLTKAIAEINLLAVNPILVSENYEVIDGQHRLQIAKDNNLWIYYLIIKEGNLHLVQMLNTIPRQWKINDFLYSYAAVGLESYKKIIEFMGKYKISASTVYTFCTGGGNNNWKKFKSGKFEISNENEVDEMISAYVKTREFCSKSTFSDREYIIAFRKLLQVISVEEFIHKIEERNIIIKAKHGIQDYLREFEFIINYKRSKNEIRLF